MSPTIWVDVLRTPWSSSLSPTSSAPCTKVAMRVRGKVSIQLWRVWTPCGVDELRVWGVEEQEEERRESKRETETKRREDRERRGEERITVRESGKVIQPAIYQYVCNTLKNSLNSTKRLGVSFDGLYVWHKVSELCSNSTGRNKQFRTRKLDLSDTEQVLEGRREYLSMYGKCANVLKDRD